MGENHSLTAETVFPLCEFILGTKILFLIIGKVFASAFRFSAFIIFIFAHVMAGTATAMLSEVRNLRAFPAFMSGLHDTIFSGK
jgi:hypothetical protein